MSQPMSESQMSRNYSNEDVIEQFRRGEFVATRGGVGYVHLKHVQALGHLEALPGQHVAYVVTIQAHMLRVPPFPNEEEAKAFVERCAKACPIGKVRA